MANLAHLKILKKGAGVWNTWRRKNPHVLCNLANANLRELDLRSADLSYADLKRAEFDHAILSHANLNHAILDHTNFRGTALDSTNFVGAFLASAEFWNANLADADFSHADLDSVNLSHTFGKGVNFSHADLRFANLSLADIPGAAFYHAQLCYTIFGDTNLADAKGLDTCVHHGPSVIDLFTLRWSGYLPDLFLRSCGLPEEFITYLPSFLDQPIQFYSCFISYAHGDKAFAHLLHDRLQGHGIRCWLDEHQLLPGDELHERIDHGIRLWDKVLLCASKASLSSWWVDSEINRAFQKEAQLMKKRGKKVLSLIPLDLDGHLFDKTYKSGKKAEITSRVAANFVGWKRNYALFDREAQRVIRALRTDDLAREKPPSSKL